MRRSRMGLRLVLLLVLASTRDARAVTPFEDESEAFIGVGPELTAFFLPSQLLERLQFFSFRGVELAPVLFFQKFHFAAV